MTQKEQLRIMVKQMIAEAVTSYRIKEIDAAGDIAANEAKMGRIKEETQKAKKVQELMQKIQLSRYLGEKLFEKVMQEMDKSIQEYESAGLELEERMSGDGKKSTKKGKKSTKKTDEESKEEVLEASDKDSEKLERYKGYTYTLDGAIVKPEINFYDNLLKAELNGRFYNLGMPVDGNVELKLQR
jgi:hypothetical protein